ncbi:flavodoxin [Olsenella sp. An188]|uniref:flavodoxin n=1 Tax=Olsenella sp. An188 TaxID=1965579 RepID=UPI000B3AF266|nr:flavodoxin [Olsenella sp. An188]OUP38667.1 flavodoxin [Olsenella sp. An188]HJB55604.1 flavodoxin [Candidatus Olsenella avistercoris]
MSSLVAYFSATGTTARAATRLAQAIGADLFEIVPERPYSAADLNWNDKSSRSSVEMANESCRPAIASLVDNMDDYDTVYVGFPVWWYVEPRIVDTFLEAHDLAGKTVVPFATSGGSGLGRAPQRMAELAPGARVAEGRMLNGNPGLDELRDWVASL